MNAMLKKISLFAPPHRADRLLLASFPTLKRGANHPCASGALEIRTSLESEPVWSRKQIHAIARAISGP
jgi:hypothetical protein